MAGTHAPQKASPQIASPQMASPLEQTRQMLDELDSLMERMLALPVNELESQPPLAVDFQSATVSATMTLLDPQTSGESNALPMQMGMGLQEPVASDPVIPEYSTPEAIVPEAVQSEAVEPQLTEPIFESQILPNEMEGLANYLTEPKSVSVPDEDTLEPALGLLPDELMPSSILKMSTPPVEPLPMPAWTLGSLLLQPLYWANGGFDRFTMLFGPLGGVLRHPIGRNFLGIAGLGMIGLAVAWLVKDWLGWTW